MINDLDKLTNIIRTIGMIYFINNIQELKEYIIKLKELNSINSRSAEKMLYYTLLELLELLQEEKNINNNIEYEIKQLENKFLDYIGIVKESLRS